MSATVCHTHLLTELKKLGRPCTMKVGDTGYTMSDVIEYIEGLRRELNEARANVKDLKSRYDDLQLEMKLEETKAELDETKADLEELDETKAKLEELELDNTKAELDNTKAELVKTKKQLDDARRTSAEALNAVLDVSEQPGKFNPLEENVGESAASDIAPPESTKASKRGPVEASKQGPVEASKQDPVKASKQDPVKVVNKTVAEKTTYNKNGGIKSREKVTQQVSAKGSVENVKKIVHEVANGKPFKGQDKRLAIEGTMTGGVKIACKDGNMRSRDELLQIELRKRKQLVGIEEYYRLVKEGVFQSS